MVFRVLLGLTLILILAGIIYVAITDIQIEQEQTIVEIPVSELKAPAPAAAPAPEINAPEATQAPATPAE
jgi:hypothetical protein